MNDLISQAGESSLPAVKAAGNVSAMLAKDAKGFLPYIGLLGKNSKLTSPPTNFTAGHFTITANQKPEDLGNELDVILLDSRPLAWKYSAAESVRLYDDEDPEFVEIAKMSALKDEELEERGDSNSYSYGAEYLLYLPGRKECATFFAGNPTMRRAAAEWQHLVEERALITFQSKWIDPPKLKYAWWGMEHSICTTGDQYESPDMAMLTDEILKFQKTEKSEAVADEESEDQ